MRPLVLLITLIIVVVTALCIRLISMDDSALLVRVNTALSAEPLESPIVKTSNFPWATNLKKKYKTMYLEYVNFLSKRKAGLFGDLMPHFNDNGIDEKRKWRTVVLFAYNRKTNYADLFPKTMKLLKNCPDVTMAMFSVMEPGAKLSPHRGFYRGVIRYHIGLKTPKGDDCSIHVLNRNNKDLHRYVWRDGEDVAFDDTCVHWVENNTDEDRVIMFLDVKRRFKDPILDMLNSYMFHRIKKSTDPDFLINQTIEIINNTF